MARGPLKQNGYTGTRKMRGIVIRNKARLVAQVYTQEEGIDYDEVFASVANIEAIRLSNDAVDAYSLTASASEARLISHYRMMSNLRSIRLEILIEVHHFFDDMLKAFDMDDLVMLWSLVKDKFNSTEPTDDKEREIWVDGYDHVSTAKDGVDIYMLVEREYPLSRGVLTQMLVVKLLVEQNNEMSRELLRKIFMQFRRRPTAKGVGLRVADSYTGNHLEDGFTPLETIRRLLVVIRRRSHSGFEGEAFEPERR
ncbi:putative reverse transcriptase domain-containing protein, partial [Tanacetum coccineum]